MKDTIKLLVVEDNDDLYSSYEDSAEEYKSNSVEFKLTRYSTTKEALEALLSKQFDCAIVDLNLDQNCPGESSGNEILLKIYESHRFPVFVVSGNLVNVDDKIKESESHFLKLYNRDTSNGKIFNELAEIYLTGITKILGGEGDIEDKLKQIFWKHLANDLDVWIKDPKDKDTSLLRYTITHMLEYLDLSSNQDTPYREAEFYIKPPIREHIASGDVIKCKNNGGRFIVLSPACDIAVRSEDENGVPKINAKKILIAKLVEIKKEEFISRGIIKEGDSVKICKSILTEIIKGQSGKFVFLPEYTDLFAAVADLQDLHSIDFSRFRENYIRQATISSPFLKDIQSRLSSYYGRQGQPDLDKKELINKYCASFKGA